jgi:outer membrane protein assembly factor BamB
MKKLLFLSFLAIAGIVYSQDAQFRGANRDGIYPDVNLLKEWPADGPKLLMKVEGIGVGWSSAVVSNGVIFVTGMVDTIDYLSAISLNGNFLWKKSYGRSWTGSYPDTRVTPTVEDNRVYVMNGTGTLYCFNAKDGSVIWSFDVDKTYESKWHRWGVAENPLIVDDKIVCTPCGAKASVVALDKMTGKPVWQSPPTGGYRSYVAPIIYKYKNFRYVLASTYQHLLAVDPQTGSIIWQYAYNPNNKAITINSPVYKDDEIFMSNGYDYRSAMIKMAPDGKSVTEKWLNETLDNHHHGMVVIGNYIYGSNWLNNTAGNWVCLDWDKGEVKWEQDWYCKGPVISADGMLYIIDEKNGNVGLVKPNPEKFELVSTFKLTKGRGEFWAHPTIYDGKLYIRYNNDLMVYDIRKK